jgi:hypothetical protein
MLSEAIYKFNITSAKLKWYFYRNRKINPDSYRTTKDAE